MSRRKFEDGARVVLKSNALLHIRDQVGNEVGIVNRYIYGGYNSGYYEVYWKHTRNKYNIEARHLDHASDVKTLTDREGLEKNLEKIKSEMESLRKKVSALTDKLNFMDEHELDTFDQDLFTAYEVMAINDEKDLSRLEKAKRMVEVIRGR